MCFDWLTPSTNNLFTKHVVTEFFENPQSELLTTSFVPMPLATDVNRIQNNNKDLRTTTLWSIMYNKQTIKYLSKSVSDIMK